MDKSETFLAYPSAPKEVFQPIDAAVSTLNDRSGENKFLPWPQLDIAGKQIGGEVLGAIRDCDTFVADITRLNFNVLFELGFALSLGKRIMLIKNSSLKYDSDLEKETGITDSIGYKNYLNSDDLQKLLLSAAKITPSSIPDVEKDRNSPVYLVLSKEKTDFEIRVISRVKKKARLQYRSFDAEETFRLSAFNAHEHVAKSHGVVLPLLAKIRRGSEAHNLRCAFVAGLTYGHDVPLLMLQMGTEPIPLDIRDFAESCTSLDNVNEFVSDFVPQIAEQLQSDSNENAETKSGPLIASVSFGQSAAENEFTELDNYYIEVDEYQRALRGELQVVTGRKGSGKTALFGYLRNHLRRDRRRVILDLKPEGYQLQELAEALDRLSQANRVHVIASFWEYLLQLEIASKLLQKDRNTHRHDHTIQDLYRSLKETYFAAEHHGEGDFAERLSALAERISNDLRGATESGDVLTTDQISEVLYKHDIANLREKLVEYLSTKGDIWILFDNLDKGWSAFGIRQNDMLLVEGLIDAMSKMKRIFQKNDIRFVGIVFLRNDAFELLMNSMPDRGKIAQANLDWVDPDLFRLMLVRRIRASVPTESFNDFSSAWSRLSTTYINGEDTSQYLIDRSLMRPRALLDLVAQCRAQAVNLEHDKITEDDIRNGESAFSTDLVSSLDFEIRDVFPKAEGIIYEFIEESAWIPATRMREILQSQNIDVEDAEQIVGFLLWYGVLGILREKTTDSVYIYDVQYDMRKLRAIAKKEDPLTYRINPAFWAGLEIVDRDD